MIHMQITAPIFEAYLTCPTKCFLQAHNEVGTGNAYADWVRTEIETYRNAGVKPLTDRVTPDGCVTGLAGTKDMKTATWRLAVDAVTQAGNLESKIHAIERIPSEGRGKAAQFIPVRFIFRNKLTKDDKLVLAFDALVLSGMLGRTVSIGKIIHGDDHSTLKVKTASLSNRVSKLTEKIRAMLSQDKAPDLVLNRYCGECEFQIRCRQKAVEKDDLSLLAGMSEKERKKLNSKGIFTVTQLSYTFRPRRRPKRLSDKREKYHHALKALAVREKKIHIVGAPELKVEGTPIYLDVEGLPDHDFYYLIGMRIVNGQSVVQHSLWADTIKDEGKIWRQFLGIIETVEKPVLIHYGSYETIFLKRMGQRYGNSLTDASFAMVESSLNALSFVFGQIYFPTFSNGLKDVARFIGFDWSDPDATGTKTISLRHEWEISSQACVKNALLTYNTEDCIALQRILEFLYCIRSNRDMKTGKEAQNIVNTENLPREGFGRFGANQFQLPGLDEINKAAYWDYQREKVLVKTNKQRRQAPPKHARRNPKPRANKVVDWPAPSACPKCNEQKLYKHGAMSKTVLDVRFSASGLRRWVTRFDFHRYRCTRCHTAFHNPDRVWSAEKFGHNLRDLVAYLIVELRLPQETVATFLQQLLGMNVCRGTIHKLKVAAAQIYQETYDNLLNRIVAGHLVHADETKIDFKSRIGYIWAFTNLSEVAFVFAESREGDLVKSLLKDFKGVLVSDFYAAYDGIECPQQKCLIHLIRDLNNDLIAEPFNKELKGLIADFTLLLRPIIATVDRSGLKTRFLHKHKIEVDRFYRAIHGLDLSSETAQKCRARLEKNRNSLFTFLDYDDVPWNNNNAEHAIKSFVFLRRIISGVTTEKGIREYLVLLSICQTCKCMGVDFLDFLRSGEKDIEVFAQTRQRRRSP
jgi:predicted RecB family nuclease